MNNLSPSYDCSRTSPLSCSPQTVVNTSFDGGFQQPQQQSVPLSPQHPRRMNTSPSCEQGHFKPITDFSPNTSMPQCIRNAYGELYPDQDTFTPVTGMAQLPPSPECGYRGGEMPSSPSSQSDVSSCISADTASWGGARSPKNPTLHAGFPNTSMGQYSSVQNTPHTHTFTTEQQVFSPHQTIHHGYDACSPAQFVTVPTQNSCQANVFDACAFPGFVMGHNDNGTVNTKPKRKRIITKVQRKAANIRERKRMFSLNEAFDVLRTKVPKFSYEKKMSRIETLRLAITYISFMTDVVHGKDPSDVKLPVVKKFDFSGLSDLGLSF